MRKQGFTLIELMIVIAIIAIIAAIAIPNLLSGRISANENSAVAGLKLLTSSEAVWLQQDPDGNGVKDYWTYDVSCLHRMYRADGTTKVAFIPIDFAKADSMAAAASTTRAADGVFGASPTIELWDLAAPAGILPAVKSGYWFQALNTTLVTVPATTYNTNPVGVAAIPAANNSIFGFIAAPEAYGTSGINSFIVNQEGTIYANDTGSTVTPGNVWVTTAAGGLNWPSVNPTGTPGVAGRNWRVAD